LIRVPGRNILKAMLHGFAARTIDPDQQTSTLEASGDR
jgi:hypothetical protein